MVFTNGGPRYPLIYLVSDRVIDDYRGSSFNFLEVPMNFIKDMARISAQKDLANSAGEAALRKLVDIAHGDTGQSAKVRSFLLGCYNGDKFPFDLTELRGLDYELFEDCMAVLRMDYFCSQEIHTRIDGHRAIFRGWAEARLANR